MTTRTAALALAALLAGGGGSCATFQAPPTARLAFECSIPEASIVLDDQLAGRCSEWKPPGKLVVAGFHRIEIRHPDHHPHFAEVTLDVDQARVLRVVLRPELD